MDIFSKLFSYIGSQINFIGAGGAAGQERAQLISEHVENKLKAKYGTSDVDEIAKTVDKRSLDNEVSRFTREAESAHPGVNSYGQRVLSSEGAADSRASGFWDAATIGRGRRAWKRRQQRLGDAAFTNTRDEILFPSGKLTATTPEMEAIANRAANVARLRYTRPLYQKALMSLGHAALWTGYQGVMGSYKAGSFAFRAMGGVPGIGGGVAGFAGATAGTAVRGTFAALGAAELVARTVLTSTVRHGTASNALDAWLPGYRNYGWGDMRKYAVNPVAVKRGIALGFAKGAAAGFSEIANPKAPAPSYYVEAGGNIRHRNDMGFSASYGQAMLGPYSTMNMPEINPASVARVVDAIW